MSRVGLLPLSSHSPPWGLSMLGPLTFFFLAVHVLMSVICSLPSRACPDSIGKVSLSLSLRRIGPFLSLLCLSHDLWGTPSPSVPRLVGDTFSVCPTTCGRHQHRNTQRPGGDASRPCFSLSSVAYFGELVRRGRSSTGVLPQVRLGSLARVRSSGEVWWDGSVAIAVQLVGSVFWVSPASCSSRYLLGPCGFLLVFYSWLQFLVAVPLPLVEAL